MAKERKSVVIKSAKLVPVNEVPASSRGQKSSWYSPVIEEFLKSNEDCVRVDVEFGEGTNGNGQNAVAQRLRDGIRKMEAPVSVVIRGDVVYLQKKTTEEVE